MKFTNRQRERGAGSRYEVLNKSAVVLLVGCWEAFVEDLARSAFEILLKRAKVHLFSLCVYCLRASRGLKEDLDGRKVWQLAGKGWKDVLERHKQSIFGRYIGKLNTPKPANVDSLYKELLGINSISANWHWPGMSIKDSKVKLTGLVELRGAIAHRVKATRAVHKRDVKGYIDFINRIAIETSNQLSDYLKEKTKKRPWILYSYATRRERRGQSEPVAVPSDTSH